MRWTDRQLAMLRAMGVAPWTPEALRAIAAARGAGDDEGDPGTTDDQGDRGGRGAFGSATGAGAASAADARAVTREVPALPAAAPGVTVRPEAVASVTPASRAGGAPAGSVAGAPAHGVGAAASARATSPPREEPLRQESLRQESLRQESPRERVPVVGAQHGVGLGDDADARARQAAIAAMGWDDLRDAAAHCQACGLCRTRRQSVFGVGHPQAHWLVVGEAPGEQEDLQGEPFVGAAGQLLDAMLRALSLTRSADGPAPPSQRVYIANTLKCRPPHNRNPSADEMAACEPLLWRQIELLQPRIILAMGRFAVQALLRSSEPIGRLRGRVHQYRGVPLVVTYHPAYLLRNLPDKARAWDDLCLAAETAEQGGEAHAPRP